MIRKNRLISGAALTAILAPNLLLAEGRQIEEVIVTAERQEASIQDTSISITAFTGEFIDDFGIRNQEDLQNFVPERPSTTPQLLRKTTADSITRMFDGIPTLVQSFCVLRFVRTEVSSGVSG